MRPMLWFLLAMAINLVALDMIVFYADVPSAAMLVPLVFVSFAMALVKAEYPNLWRK